MIYIINSPVLTNFGSYEYKECTVDDLKKILRNNEFISAVGHEETATLLTRLLDVHIPYNRIVVHQEAGDIFIVIKPKARLEINKIYSETDIENIGYELGILTKLK